MRDAIDGVFPRSKTLLLGAFVLLTGCDTIVSTAEAAESSEQAGKTTRYWDCCKPSGGWSGKAAVSSPVRTCAKDGVTAVSASTKNACDGGTSYMATAQQPWQISSTQSYGFAAATIAGGNESTWLCSCYNLSFGSATAVAGKSMIVQVIATGVNSSWSQFDLLIPGGGVGIFNGCSSQWNAPADGWGARYGGVSSASQCDQLPASLQPGCNWRFDWFNNANNPNMTFHRVKCPTAITAKTGCVRNDDGGYPAN